MTDAEQIYAAAGDDSRSLRRAIGRGLKKKCPQCSRGKLFSGYTSTASECAHCGLDFSGHEADDAPPYLTILVIGHLSIPLALVSKQLFDPPLWQQFVFWGPAILIATFWFLPIAKGALIGVQWANRLHGFASLGGDPNGDA